MSSLKTQATEIINHEGIPKNIESLINMSITYEDSVRFVPMGPSSMLSYLAQELYTTIDLLSVKELPITVEELTEYLEYVFNARVFYVAGLGLSEHPKSVEFPTLMWPILAAVGKVWNGEKGVTIHPIPKQEDEMFYSLDEDTGKLTRKKALSVPDSKFKVLNTLKAWGVSMATGLPMSRDSEDDVLFQLVEVDGYIKGVHGKTSPAYVYARSMFDMTFLSSLYGDARVQYTTLTALRSGICDIVGRHVRGPSRSIAN